MNTNSKRSLLVLVQMAVLATSGVAMAAEPAHTTAVKMARYYDVQAIERTRSGTRSHATFDADPAAVADGADLVFEARSVSGSHSTLRWRCVAKNDVQECLSHPLKVKYRTADDKVVLTVTVVPDGAVQAPLAIALAD